MEGQEVGTLLQERLLQTHTASMEVLLMGTEVHRQKKNIAVTYLLWQDSQGREDIFWGKMEIRTVNTIIQSCKDWFNNGLTDCSVSLLMGKYLETLLKRDLLLFFKQKKTNKQKTLLIILIN